MKIIFLGTPDFAVPCLDILLQNGYDVVAVVTSVDKYGGRNRKQLIESAVKKYAIEKNLKVLQPPNLKSKKFLDELRSLQADLQIVVAFRMLPVVVWDMPRHGTYNLHGSLLPAYRGAAPIHWAVMNGESETGVTTFKLKHEIDTGDILFQEKMPIYTTDTTGQVHDRMMVLGAQTILKTVKAVEEGETEFFEQDETKVSKAPKIYTDTCQINFDQPSQRVYNFIRGLSPYPTSWTKLHDKKLKIFATRYVVENHSIKPGEFLIDKTSLRIATQDGFIIPIVIQYEGKRKMKLQDFLNGLNLEEN